MATDDRGARFDRIVAELREAWVPRSETALRWDALARMGRQSAIAAIRSTTEQAAGALLRFAILYLLDAIDRLETVDGH